MLLKDLNTKIKPISIAYSLKETPHLSIETNFTCNLNCKACYNMNKDYVKTFDQIKEEIMIAAGKRNLETITVIGGEPTLHPDLPEIVRFIRKQNIHCQILTNGIVYMDDDEDILLKKCIDAGVDRIVIHVDEGQKHYHGDIDKAIRKLFDKFEKHKISFGLSATIYDDTINDVPGMITKYTRYKYYDGVIGYLVRDVEDTLVKRESKPEHPKMEDFYASVTKELNIQPCAYLPSSFREDYISWMIYLFFINNKTGETFSISPSLIRFGRKITRMRTGRNTIGGYISKRTFRISLIAMFMLEIMFNIRSFKSIMKLTRKSAGLKNIRQMFITMQNPPEFDHETGLYHFCYNCPDATVRNGVITPLCIADFVDPINGEGDLTKNNPERKKEVTKVVRELLKYR
ncbi:MAG: radical SAM protein [Bacteroidales bacterium]|jgi:MoaA/NifB/PqqE/SkfB family radical SAM enzyme|nr:radical SAM protein [Bacteroidales bacterium]